MAFSRWTGLLVAGLVALTTVAASEDTAFVTRFHDVSQWKPGPGTGLPEVIDGALRFPVRFIGNQAERAYWDLAVSLDLGEARGVRIRFRCTDWLPVGSISCYFKSGGGWYSIPAASADPVPGRSDWYEVVFPLSGASSEGSPARWSQIDALRLAIWRGADADTVIDMTDPGILRGRRDVVLVDGGTSYAATFDQALAGMGIPARIIGEADVTSARLRDARIVILPHNPNLSGSALEAITAFVQAGGKVVSCFTLPASLAQAMGLRRGSYATNGPGGDFAAIISAGDRLPGLPSRTLQASWNILGAEPLPGRGRVAATWQDASGADTGIPAIVVTDRGAYLSHVLLTDDWTRKQQLALALVGHAMPDLIDVAVAHTLDSLRETDDPDAQETRMRAFALAAEGNPAAALTAAEDARDATVRAQARHLRPVPGEFRGFWCHSAFGASPLSWDETAASLKLAGFTAVLPNMAWGGLAYYPSQVLPVYGEIDAKGDQVRACLDACRKHGIEIHVWKVCWNMGEKAPDSFSEKMQREGRTQVRRNGTREARWLCPTHPANQTLERDALLEIARNYPVDGIHLDYIRFPGSDTCFCAGCRKRFEARLGHAVSGWPGSVTEDPALRTAWLDFRRENITRFVKDLRQGLQAINPAIKLSAAVFPSASLDRDRIGQDWAAWCRDGLVDFVCPMTYTPLTPQFEAQARQQTAWAQPAACYPGIGFSTWRDPQNTGRLLDQIEAARRSGAGGFTVFDLKPGVPQTVLPVLAEGLRRPAQQN